MTRWLLEKVFLLHKEFGKPDATKIRSERMSRHLYDLSSMIDTDSETQALADHTLYDTLIVQLESYQRISWVNYETLGHKTIMFIPPDRCTGVIPERLSNHAGADDIRRDYPV